MFFWHRFVLCCFLPAFCVHLHWKSMRHWKILKLRDTLLSKFQNMGALSTLFSWWIQNTALYQLLRRKWALSQLKSGQNCQQNYEESHEGKPAVIFCMRKLGEAEISTSKGKGKWAGSRWVVLVCTPFTLLCSPPREREKETQRSVGLSLSITFKNQHLLRLIQYMWCFLSQLPRISMVLSHLSWSVALCKLPLFHELLCLPLSSGRLWASSVVSGSQAWQIRTRILFCFPPPPSFYYYYYFKL